MAHIKNRLGERFTTTEGYEVEIVSYTGFSEILVKFLLCGQVVGVTNYNSLKKGILRYKNKVSIYSMGYHGYGKYKGVDIKGKEEKSYGTWRGMLRRCYYLPHQEKHPTYIGCTVDERWHNYQVFAEWFENNWKDYMDNYWQLDKDILVKGNKIYSPETCAFVPKEINSYFINNDKTSAPKSIKKYKNKVQVTVYRNNKTDYLGTFETYTEGLQAYKTAKESYIKTLANKWKCQIDEVVYQALVNYRIEIID